MPALFFHIYKTCVCRPHCIIPGISKTLIMGMYMFVTELDRTIKRKVFDAEVNREFQAALAYDPTLMIDEYEYQIPTPFWKARKFEIRYNIYHETPAFDGSAYQARYQLSGSGEAKTVIAYLHGICNGVNHCFRELEKSEIREVLLQRCEIQERAAYAKKMALAFYETIEGVPAKLMNVNYDYFLSKYVPDE